MRLWAADVETLLRDEEAERAWVEEHLDRFPADAAGVRRAGSAASEKNAPGA